MEVLTADAERHGWMSSQFQNEGGMSMKRMIVTMMSGVVAVLALSSCTGPQVKLGEQKIVERMPDNVPDWKMKSEFEEQDKHYFQGVVTNVGDMALGLRQARAEGEK